MTTALGLVLVCWPGQSARLLCLLLGAAVFVTGVIYLLEVSGAFGAGINLILQKTKGREFSVVCIFYTIFVIFGVLGYGEAAYPFYPLAVTIGFALGYDRMVGTGLAIIGSTVGFTSGLMNTFTTGVAQQISTTASLTSSRNWVSTFQA